MEYKNMNVPAVQALLFVKDLSIRTSADPNLILGQMSFEELVSLAQANEKIVYSQIWGAVFFARQHNFQKLIEKYSLSPLFPYDLKADVDLESEPLGYNDESPEITRDNLVNEPFKLSGLEVDFPLCMPASMLSQNSTWIEFYAKRGFDILTYKTVRSQYKLPHKWPHWSFIESPTQFTDTIGDGRFVGAMSPFPDSLADATMANSFGIPSLQMDWWAEDVRKAKDSLLAIGGNKVLIVSVAASVREDESNGEEELIKDFVRTSIEAKESGADIVELNFSCPNTKNEKAGSIFLDHALSAVIAEKVKKIIGDTPLFIKIGFLPRNELFKLVEGLIENIDGIVAINAIDAQVDSPDDHPYFKGRDRRTAGITGWAIKNLAHQVACDLVEIRKELCSENKRRFDIIGVGGVATRKDFRDRLQTGVEAVGVCTGAFLNKDIGINLRLDLLKLSSKLEKPASITSDRSIPKGPITRSDASEDRSHPLKGVKAMDTGKDRPTLSSELVLTTGDLDLSSEEIKVLSKCNQSKKIDDVWKEDKRIKDVLGEDAITIGDFIKGNF